ncbi:hypothetical protein BEWA_033170 [Theileria equi strain WA]|uniref:ARID domain-containing protein n=1 Tax=Theileria equi strain WA TaxID=1537102 RepID=L0B016_THEEQ|nr:hypothetical protein BEWA_033170 [Theileria equi strain WA]AFZ80464.1 hypothetical protein BEWA_033170 [Theileria equi strain WA]|eukprot:XP_004830130.1 hypothetical protein BEWA_033170 [Theileria equi strain WA]
MTESNFLKCLQEFHGADKWSDLSSRTVLGQNINLFRFYESAKRRGGVTATVIMTCWREICVEIGVINSDDSVSLEEARKASQYFLECFNNFNYQESLDSESTNDSSKALEQKVPEEGPPNVISDKQEQSKSRKNAQVPDEENLIWMAKQHIKTIAPKVRVFFKNGGIGLRGGDVPFNADTQWILPSYDKSLPLPYNTQYKVAYAAKMAADLPNFLSRLTTDDAVPAKDNSSAAESMSIETVCKGIISEVMKLLITRQDVDVCLDVIFKAITLSNVSRVPGLHKQILSITMEISKELSDSNDYFRQREIVSMLNLSCGIVDALVFNSFNSPSNPEVLPDNLENSSQETLYFLESLRAASCALFKRVHRLFSTFSKNAARNNSINRRRSRTVGSIGPFDTYFSPGDHGVLLERKNSAKYVNDICDVNAGIQVIVSSLNTIINLCKSAKSPFQIDILSLYFGNLSEVFVNTLQNNRVPRYWLWKEFQYLLCIFLTSACEYFNKASLSTHIKIVKYLHIISLALLHEQKLQGNTLVKVLELLNVLNNSDLNVVGFMKPLILCTCKILTERAIEITRGNLLSTLDLNKFCMKENEPPILQYDKCSDEKYFNPLILNNDSNQGFSFRLSKAPKLTGLDLPGFFNCECNPLLNPWSLLLGEPWNSKIIKNENTKRKCNILQRLFCDDVVSPNKAVPVEDAVSYLQLCYKYIFGLSYKISQKNSLNEANKCESNAVVNRTPTANELVFQCLTKLTRYDFCLSEISAMERTFLECAFSDSEHSKLVWPLIHILMSGTCKGDYKCPDEPYQVSFVNHIK